MIIIINSRDDVFADLSKNNNNRTAFQEQKFKWDAGDHWGRLTLMIVFQPFLISFFITCLSKYFWILEKNRKEPVKLEIKEVTGLM